MGAPWYEPLRPLCGDARELAGCDAPVEAFVFYLARWCQKETGEVEPNVTELDLANLADMAARVAGNLRDDGAVVERLVAGEAGAWTELRRQLWASAHPRVSAAADEFADEALQKIAVVLLTGTPPSQAVERLAEGVEGPRNEYVFASPISHWARAVVINLIVDEKRRAARERRPPRVSAPQKASGLDAATLKRAHAALPALLAAVRELPRVQRAVMVWSLARGDLDAAVTARLFELAPDLFNGLGDGRVSTDQGIAERLDTTPRLVAANRSAARCKLAARDPLWKLLLDVLLPHRSTRPTPVEDEHG